MQSDQVVLAVFEGVGPDGLLETLVVHNGVDFDVVHVDIGHHLLLQAELEAVQHVVELVIRHVHCLAARRRDAEQARVGMDDWFLPWLGQRGASKLVFVGGCGGCHEGVNQALLFQSQPVLLCRALGKLLALQGQQSQVGQEGQHFIPQGFVSTEINQDKQKFDKLIKKFSFLSLKFYINLF
jgi:hypothetical protein